MTFDSEPALSKYLHRCDLDKRGFVMPGSDWMSRVSAYNNIRTFLRGEESNGSYAGSIDASYLLATALEHSGGWQNRHHVGHVRAWQT
jgi:hypothetical protein